MTLPQEPAELATGPVQRWPGLNFAAFPVTKAHQNAWHRFEDLALTFTQIERRGNRLGAVILKQFGVRAKERKLTPAEKIAAP